MIKKYALYLVRWQLSTPILAVVLYLLEASTSTTVATIIANFVGGLIFFWVDKFIFKNISKHPLWEIRDEVTCVDCGHVGRGYRVAEWLGYDRKQDKHPEFRCENCKDAKLLQVSRKVNKLQ